MAYTNDELAFFNAKLEQRFAVLKQHLLIGKKNNKPRLLDVGCGEGYALAFFRQQNWEVRGLDFSSAGVESKNSACLDALVTGDIFTLLENEIQEGRSYDVVWLQNVLEHVLDPLSLLRSLRNLIAPEGLAVVTVPNDCSVTQKELTKLGHIEQAFWVSPPEHLTYFDYLSLIAIANETGWEKVEILGDFPVDWFLFNTEANYIRDQTAGKPAHRARVQIENMLKRQPMEDILSFYSTLAKIGQGRNITAFFKNS